MIQNFKDFCRELNTCGFSMGGISHTAKRIYNIVRDGYVALHEIKALDAEESYEKIYRQILLLNPMAKKKIIRKIIKG